MPAYPSILPPPTSATGITHDQPLSRTRMSSGRVRQRRLYTSDRRQLSVKFQFSDVEYLIWQSFLNNDTGNGADSFDIALPIGAGLTTYAARIVGSSYKASYYGVNRWEVTATLEIYDIDDDFLT